VAVTDRGTGINHTSSICLQSLPYNKTANLEWGWLFAGQSSKRTVDDSGPSQISGPAQPLSSPSVGRPRCSNPFFTLKAERRNNEVRLCRLVCGKPRLSVTL